MEPKNTSQLDQALTAIAEDIPPALWRFFANCKEQGFSEAQAFLMTVNLLNAIAACSRS